MKKYRKRNKREEEKDDGTEYEDECRKDGEEWYDEV